MTSEAAEFWDRLHQQPRYRPVYPSEHAVRFLMTYYRAGFEGQQLGRALDIGVGGGRHTALLCEFGFHTTGIDISLEGLLHTRARLRSHGRAADLVRSPMALLAFRSESFDTVLSYGVFYYGMRAEMVAAVGELHRVLKPGGRALVVTRTTDDYRYGKGDELESGTFRLRISDTSEEGTIQHFVSERELRDIFADFARVRFEKMETTFAERRKRNSDWIVDLQK